MIVNEELYLEHYGKTGMKWGSRKTKKAQRGIDIVRRVASGTGTTSDVNAAIKTGLLSEKKIFDKHKGNASSAAREALDRQKRVQSSIKKGKSKSVEILSKTQGINIKELNYSYTNPNK
jgi:hypothetical protein